MNVLILGPVDANEITTLLETVVKRLGHRLLRPGDDGSTEERPLLSFIDRAAAVIVVLDSTSPHLLLEVGYALGASKPLLVLAPAVSWVPESLLELPFLPLKQEPDVIASRIEAFLSEANQRPMPAVGEQLDSLEVLMLFRKDPRLFELVTPARFEQALFEVFQRKNCEPQRISAALDYGFDFTMKAPSDGVPVLVQTRKWRRNVKVGLKDVQQLYGAVAAYGAPRGLLISASGFTESAAAFSSRVGQVEIWDMDKVLAFVEKPAA
jgi:hypothetical protein